MLDVHFDDVFIHVYVDGSTYKRWYLIIYFMDRYIINVEMHEICLFGMTLCGWMVDPR